MAGRPITKPREYRTPIETIKARLGVARKNWAISERDNFQVGDYFDIKFRLGTEYTGSRRVWVPCELIQKTPDLLIFENREDESKNCLHYTVSIADLMTGDAKVVAI